MAVELGAGGKGEDVDGVVTDLAYRRDEVGGDPAEILRLAARGEFEGHPPDAVRSWLAERGVRV